jgi:selenocysteine-specific elongation factor
MLGGSPPAVAPDVAAAIDDCLVAAVDHEPGIHAAELVRGGVVEIRRRASLSGRSAGEADELGRRIVADRLAQLVAAGQLVRQADRVVPPGAVASGPSAELSAAMDRLVAALSTDSPPPLGLAARDAGCPPDGIRLLEAANRIVRLDDDLAWAFPTYRELAARAVVLAAETPLTPAVFRDATGTSRKYVMAILEDLDRRAILRRTPAGHVPGPRAPHVAGASPAQTADVGAR